MTGHDRWADSLGAYMLGALPEDERHGFEIHLASCPACRGDVERLRPAADALPAAADQFTAPPELRDRIMRVVNAEAELLRAARPGTDAPPPRAARRRLRLPTLSRTRPAFALATTAVALAIGLGGGLLLAGDESGPVTRTLAASVSVPQGSAQLVVDGDHGRIVADGLPEPGAGRVYQVWLKRPGRPAPEPTDALFSVRRGGVASVDVPGRLEEVEAVLVTSEPEGGSDAPSRAPIIVARLA